MEMFDAKRVEIIIEATMERRLKNLLIDAGITGFTILPVHGGSGRSGKWSREGEVSRAAGMVAFICLLRPERVDTAIETAMSVLETHIGVISVTDAQVMRAERF